MNDRLFIKGLIVAVISIALGSVAYSRYSSDVYNDNPRQQRYLPYLNGLLLPVCFPTVILIGASFYGLRYAIELALPMCFTIFAHISIYYFLLLLLSPLLQKHLIASSCAMLWMLPNFLYLIFNELLALSPPKIILHISESALTVLSIIWFTGFIAVIVHAYIQHFIFRKQILQCATEVTAPNVCQVWSDEIEHARIKKPYFKLLVSSAVNAPLSIGFFPKTIRVVLPHTQYSDEELKLIFRHELIHISRCDSTNKFFLLFCKAMCWFNPIMWIGMKKSAEDMELSCDETVLLNSSDETRKTYANLLLRSAQDGRGFTTCLSATTASVRYRLKSIIDYREKNTGIILIAIISFVMLMTCGQIALAFGNHTVKEEAYEISGIENLSHQNIFGMSCTIDGKKLGSIYASDEAIFDYILNLNVAQLNGNYTFSEENNHLLILYEYNDGSFAIELDEQVMRIIPLGVNYSGTSFYHVQEGVDWDYLASQF